MRASLSSRLPAAFVFVFVAQRFVIVKVIVIVNNLWNLWDLCDVFVKVKVRVNVFVFVNNLWNLWDLCDVFVLVFRVVFLREAGLVKKIPASSKKSRSIQSENNSYIPTPFDNVPNQRSTAWRAISSQPRASPWVTISRQHLALQGQKRSSDHLNACHSVTEISQIYSNLSQ